MNDDSSDVSETEVDNILCGKTNYATNQVSSDVFLKNFKNKHLKKEFKDPLLIKHLSTSFTRLFYEKMELLTCLEKDDNISKEQKISIKTKTEKMLLENLLLAVATASYYNNPEDFVLTETNSDHSDNGKNEKKESKHPYTIARKYF